VQHAVEVDVARRVRQVRVVEERDLERGVRAAPVERGVDLHVDRARRPRRLADRRALADELEPPRPEVEIVDRRQRIARVAVQAYARGGGAAHLGQRQRERHAAREAVEVPVLGRDLRRPHGVFPGRCAQQRAFGLGAHAAEPDLGDRAVAERHRVEPLGRGGPLLGGRRVDEADVSAGLDLIVLEHRGDARREAVDDQDAGARDLHVDVALAALLRALDVDIDIGHAGDRDAEAE
jgi:hypothetical protein